mmetsp:Transcript_73362/g.174775  ORF Transcript_73362/g.174775 Transcript_73362/m.174775 type:complete len:488 (+) Transcript_73362:28-1491(+)
MLERGLGARQGGAPEPAAAEQYRPWGVAECYNLFAMHLMNKDYLMAAAAAYEMYTSLCRPFDGTAAEPSMMVAEIDYSRSGCLVALGSGGCISKAMDMPQVARRHVSLTSHLRALQRARPVLEPIRNSLLMLMSALSMTSDKLIVIPQAKFSLSAGIPEGMSAGPCSEDANSLDSLRQFFNGKAQAAEVQSVFTLSDAEKLLAVVEAEITGASRHESQSAPLVLARKAAEQGLLLMALELAQHFHLDLWQAALQPFTRLCLDLEHEGGSGHGGSSRLEEVLAAARGPAQGYMFVASDAQEPLLQKEGEHVGMDRRLVALWATLEEGLLAVSGAAPDAASIRLYSLVAEEVVAREARDASHNRGGRGWGRTLPSFLTAVLSKGPGWSQLLQVYMKYSRWPAAVELVTSRVSEAEVAVRTERVEPSVTSTSTAPLLLQAFPLHHVLKLQACMEADKDAAGDLPSLLGTLRSSIQDFQRLASEVEASLQS